MWPVSEWVGVEQPPCAFRSPVERRRFPLLHDRRDSLDVDDLPAIQLHDGVVYFRVGERHLLVKLEAMELHLPIRVEHRDGVCHERMHVA